MDLLFGLFFNYLCSVIYGGIEQWSACLAHNQEVGGSSPSSATEGMV